MNSVYLKLITVFVFYVFGYTTVPAQITFSNKTTADGLVV